MTQEVDGFLRPIIYGGRVLTDTEKRYCTTDKELLAIYFAVKRCEYYLLGNKFVVYTDHQPLTHLKAFKEIINKRFRWLLYLESVNTVVRYIPGKENILSDFVSRNIKEEEKLNVINVAFIELNMASYTKEELLEKQLNDQEINKVLKYLNEEESYVNINQAYKKVIDKLVLNDNLLFYKHHNSMLLVCPEEIRDELLSLGHNQFYSGHHGCFKTHRRLLETVWWPSLFHDVKSYIKNCKVCIMTKSMKNQSCLGKRAFPKKPNELVSIDFIVDLPVTERNNIHILTIVDNFTKYLKCYALKDRTALTACKYVYNYFLLFGIPNKLYSDRDPAYEAKLFQGLMDKLGVKKLRTTGYNPKANGLCEKSNGLVKSFLMKYVNFVGGEWDLYLNEMCYAYNTSVHSSTGFSPAELTFGRKLRIPIDIIYGCCNEEKDELFNVKEMREKLTKMYELAGETMAARQAKYLSYHDKKVFDDKLDLGTLVYMHVPKRSREKLLLKWSGPCEVISEKHPVYEIKFEKKCKQMTKWITRDKLRRCESTARYVVKKETYNLKRKNEVEESSRIFEDVEDEQCEQTFVRNNRRYNLRENIEVPERYGRPYTYSIIFS